MNVFVYLLAGLVLDNALGELPNRFHPLVSLGKAAHLVEHFLNNRKTHTTFLAGIVAFFILVLLVVLLVNGVGYLGNWTDIFWVYLCVGWSSLKQHVHVVSNACSTLSIQKIRQATSMLVGRNLDASNAQDCQRAAVESLVENFSDAVISSIFWYLVGGVYALVLHRLVNTLDAMWGYKTQRFLYFGKFVARLDDVLNYIPARLTVFTYLMVGRTALGWKTCCLYAKYWESPNAGVLIASAAGAFGVQVGGQVMYAQRRMERPIIGHKNHFYDSDILCALTQVQRSFYVALVLIGLLKALESVF